MRIEARHTGTWGYAILLVLLLTIAAVAVRQIILLIHDHLPPMEFRAAAALIMVVTFGLMLIAAAYGMWAIRFCGEAEARRRVSQLVEALDDLSDGLLVVDRKGRIAACNSVARLMMPRAPDRRASLLSAFPCLEASDLPRLVRQGGEPVEIERSRGSGADRRTLRIRAYPSERMVPVLVSDVTEPRALQEKARMLARLQLVGQLARSMAHDFDDILCTISCHGSLLAHAAERPAGQEFREALRAIAIDSERGMALASRLQSLASSATPRRFAGRPAEHVRAAASALDEALPEGWRIDCKLPEEGLPAVRLTGLQIEQLLLNLGLTAAGTGARSGNLVLSAATRPGAAEVALTLECRLPPEEAARRATRRSEAGAVRLIARSLVEGVGGDLEVPREAAGLTVYRLLLPCDDAGVGTGDAELPETLEAYVGLWSVLLACARNAGTALQDRMRQLNVKVSRADNVAAVLARLEDGERLDGIVFTRELLGSEEQVLLRAVMKLRPAAGIVVLAEDPEGEPEELSGEVAFLPPDSPPNRIVLGLIDAHGMAARRS